MIVDLSFVCCGGPGARNICCIARSIFVRGISGLFALAILRGRSSFVACKVGLTVSVIGAMRLKCALIDSSFKEFNLSCASLNLLFMSLRVSNMLNGCALLSGGCIALRVWAEQSDEAAICLSVSVALACNHFWVALLLFIIPIPSIWSKFSSL